MNRKAGVFAVIIAAIFSVLILPTTFVVSNAFYAVKVVDEFTKEETMEEMFDAFDEGGGVKQIHEIIQGYISEEGAAVIENAEDEEINQRIRDVITEDDIRRILKEVYMTTIQGEKYEFDFSFIKPQIRDIMTEYSDSIVDKIIEKDIDAKLDEYALTGETRELTRKALLKQANAKKDVTKREFMAEMDERVDKVVFQLEKTLNETVEKIYTSEDYKQLEKNFRRFGINKISIKEINGFISEKIGYSFQILIIVGIVLEYLVCGLRPCGLIMDGVNNLIIAFCGFLVPKYIGIVISSVIPDLYSNINESKWISNELLDFIDEVISRSYSNVTRIFAISGILMLGGGIVLSIRRANIIAQKQ